ncbi:matrix metalloproteinase-25 [Anguilla anguilla]|uniref:matrix metalloproteinase-25 n=1 Tax=Anguilla anguilla TaxID=7936 RepID=UPI0015AB3B5E|nr:matrix metalloproteinase-25 [Anguilla anguilla]
MICKALCVTGTVLLCVSLGLSAPMADQYSRSVDWLTRYGYLLPPDPRTGLLQTKEGIHRALRQMQRFAGLNETGELDAATVFLMSTPRCSLPDIVGTGDLRRRRRKRYALSGLQWDKADLTWSVESYPSPSTSPSLRPELVVLILTYALKTWGDVTPLRFHPLPRRGGAGGGRTEEGDIKVSFARSFHNDGYPFDGKGGTLAHAFFPGRSDLAGDVHFDDEEAWTHPGSPRFRGSTDLFTVAVHEFGHALGLSHSSSDASIMRPYYQGPVGDISSFRLPEDDRLGIQTLYGNRGGLMTPPPDSPATPSLPRPPTPPSPRPTKHLDPSHLDRCEGGYDAVANIRGEVFFFKGPYFWRVQRSGSLVSLSPALICNFWKGLPRETRRIDAVYERKGDSRIVFFIGDQYWVFKDTSALHGYPRPLSDWGLLSGDGRPSERVGAAFVWAHNGKTYLFSGGEFWRFDEGGRGARTLNTGYPRPTSLWGGVPTDPDDIMSWTDGDTYFFKNNSYWVVKSGGLDHETVTPKSIAVDWMRCPPPSTPTQLSGSCNARAWKCNCTRNRTVLIQASHWLILFSLTLIFWSLLTH